MRLRVKQIDEHFDDGSLKVYETKDVSGAGEFENLQTTLKHAGIRYQIRTVGFNRFVQNKQIDVEISKLLRVQRIPLDSSVYSVVELEDGTQYKIEQIQEIVDVYPPCLDLSLSVAKQRVEYEPEEVPEVPEDD